MFITIMAAESNIHLCGEALVAWAQAQTHPPPGKVAMIVPGLFQGNKAGAESRTDLEKKNITAILSVGGGPCRWDGMVYEHIGTKDGQSMLDQMDKAAEFIHNNLKGTGCFVHCMGGLSRSPTVIIAYLVKYRNLSLHDALWVVQQARPKAMPNGHLQSDLLKWEMEIRGCNSMELKDFGRREKGKKTK